MSDGMAESCAIIAFHVNGGNPRTGETRGFRRAGRLLRTDRVEFDGGAEAFAGIAVTHDNLKVGAGFGGRLRGMGGLSGAFSEFFRHKVIFLTLTGMVNPPTNSIRAFDSDGTPAKAFTQCQEEVCGWDIRLLDLEGHGNGGGDVNLPESDASRGTRPASGSDILDDVLGHLAGLIAVVRRPSAT